MKSLLTFCPGTRGTQGVVLALAAFTLSLIFAASGHALYLIEESGFGSGNPSSNGTTRSLTDVDLTGATVANAYNAGSNTTNQWSSAIAVPFQIRIGNNLRSAFCVSKNGLLTFTTSVAGTAVNPTLNANSALPNADLPDETFAYFWGSMPASLSSVHNVYYRIEGNSPNRQLWVFNPFTPTDGITGTGPTGTNLSVAIVFEETTHNVYVVEMDGGQTQAQGSFTVGFQLNNNASNVVEANISLSGANPSPNITVESFGAKTTATNDNEYYKFTSLYFGNDLDFTSVTVSPTNLVQSPATISFTLENMSTGNFNGVNAISVRFSTDAGSNWTTEQFSPTSLSPGGSQSFTFTNKLKPTAVGALTLWVEISAGVTGDPDANNDRETRSLDVAGAGRQPVLTQTSVGTGVAPIFRPDAASTEDVSHYVILYTAEELSAIPVGATINSLLFNKTSSGATTQSLAILQIYMRNTSKRGYAQGETWASMIAGATQVYSSGAHQINSTTGFVELASINSNFRYNGESIEVMIHWDASFIPGDPTSGGFTFGLASYSSSEGSRGMGWVGSSTIDPTTILSTSQNGINSTRPVMRLGYTPPSPPALGFAPSVLPKITANQLVTRTIVPHGGTPPYTLAIGAGAPAGWVLSITPEGELSMIAPTSDAFKFVNVPIAVTDDTLTTATSNLQVEVDVANVSYNLTNFGVGFTQLANPTVWLDSDGADSSTHDDVVSDFFDIGFDFRFYENTYSRLRIDSNGFVTFRDTTTSVAGNNTLPSGSAPNDVIALFFDDLDLSIGFSDRHIAYGMEGIAPNRVFTVEFWKVSHWGSPSSSFSGQIRLHETSNIVELLYASSGQILIGFTGTIGVEDATGSRATQVTNNQTAAPTTNYRFTPNYMPRVNPPLLPDAFASDAYDTYVNVGLSSQTATWTYTQISGFPGWLNIEASSGRLTGTAAGAGSVHDLVIQASDGTTTFQSTHRLRVFDQRLQITNTDRLKKIREGQSVNIQLGTQGQQNAVSWAFAAYENASWLNLSASGLLTSTAAAPAFDTRVRFDIIVTDNTYGPGRRAVFSFDSRTINSARAIPLIETFQSGTDIDFIKTLGPRARYSEHSLGASQSSTLGMVFDSRSAVLNWNYTNGVLDDPSTWPTQASDYFGETEFEVSLSGQSELALRFDYKVENDTGNDRNAAFIFEISEDNGNSWTAMTDGNESTAAGIYRTPTGGNFQTFTKLLQGLTGSSLLGRFRWLVQYQRGLASNETFIGIDNLSLTVPLAIITPPTLPSVQELSTGYSIFLQAANGSQLSYTWSLDAGTPMPSGMNFNTATGEISGTPALASFGTYPLNVTVNDTISDVTLAMSLEVTLRPLNITTNSPLIEVEEDATYTVQFAATGGTEQYTWTIQGTGDPLPAGLSLNASTGLITGDPDRDAAVLSPYNMVVRVTDNLGGPTVFFEKTIQLTVNRRPLSITTVGPLTTGVELSNYSFTLAGFGGTDVYTWSIDSNAGPALPNGLSLNANTGEISGAPALATAAVRNLVVVLDDGEVSVNKTLQFTIERRPLVVQTTTLPEGTEGVPYMATLSGTGGTDNFSWFVDTGISDELPDGLTLDAQTGVISGTPVLTNAPSIVNAAATYDITFLLYDGFDTAPAFLPIKINRQPLVLTTTVLPNAIERSAYTGGQLAGMGGTGGPYTFSVDPSSTAFLPASLTLNPNTGEITGTPVLGDNGTLNILFRIEDTEQTATQVVTLVIDISPMEILTDSLPAATIGTAYNEQILAFSPLGDSAVTWALAAGSDPLPAGLNLDMNSGVLSGTPLQGSNGAYNLIILADDTNTQDTANLLLRVSAAVNRAPNVEAGDDFSLSGTGVDGFGNALFELNGSATDPDGDELETMWSLQEGPGGGNLAPLNPASLMTPLSVVGPSIVGGTYIFTLTATESSTGINYSDTVVVTVITTTTIPPAAHAGVDRTVQTDIRTLLFGAESSAQAPNFIIGYLWKSVSAPTGAIVQIRNESPPGVAQFRTASFTPTLPGTYVFSLQVTSNANLKSRLAYVTYYAVPDESGNTPPRAEIQMSFSDLNGNNSVNVGEAVTLFGSGVDADTNDQTFFVWSQVTGPASVVLTNPTTAVQTLVFTQPGNYRMRLNVSDSSGDSGIPAEIWIAVAAAGRTAPTAVASLDPADAPNGDNRVTFLPVIGIPGGTGSNGAIDLRSTGSSTGANIAYEWRQVAGPTVDLINANQPNASFVPVLSRTYTFELRVIDRTDANAPVYGSAQVELAVSTYDPFLNPTGNAVPVAIAGASTGNDIVRLPIGSVLNLSGLAQDANDGNEQDRFTFLWTQISGPPVLLYNQNTGTPLFFPKVQGEYRFSLRVDDKNDISLEDTVTVVVGNPTVSGPPAPLPESGGCSISGRSSTGFGWLLSLLATGAVAGLRRRSARTVTRA